MSQMHKKALVFGALNRDYVYDLEHIVQPGETILSRKLKIYSGGKGLNQAVALARAGCDVSIAGKIGTDGEDLKRFCQDSDVNVNFIMVSDLPTGNAVIQVEKTGENSIILFSGANYDQTEQEIRTVLAEFSKGDYLFLQNEVNKIDRMIREGYERGMKIVFNPSPFEPKLLELELDKVNWFILNEVELYQMTGIKDIEIAFEQLKRQFPHTGIVLTMGARGARCFTEEKEYRQESYRCEVVDTTSAGDTFTGFFFAHLMKHEKEIQEALDEAAKASAITVSRKGAAETIPSWKDLK